MQYNIKQFIFIKEFYPTLFCEMQPIALIADKIYFCKRWVLQRGCVDINDHCHQTSEFTLATGNSTSNVENVT
jgi:hypothetical protein